MKDGAFVFLFRDDTRREIFLVYRSDWPIWSIIGGGIEKDETPRDAAIREASEETGFKVKIIRPVGVKTRFSKKDPSKIIYKAYYFEGRIISGTFKPEFPGCMGKWFNINRLPIDLLDVSRKVILLGAKSSEKQFITVWPQNYQLRDWLIFFRHPIAGIRYLTKK